MLVIAIAVTRIPHLNTGHSSLSRAPKQQTQTVREERLSVSVLSFGFDSLICQHPSPEQTAIPAIPALCPDEHQWANPAGHGLLGAGHSENYEYLY